MYLVGFITRILYVHVSISECVLILIEIMFLFVDYCCCCYLQYIGKCSTKFNETAGSRKT
jgi:hypothetical protein